MPLLKLIQQVKFKRYVPMTSPAHTIPADIQAQFGYEAKDKFYPAVTYDPRSEDQKTSLIKKFSVKGFSSEDAKDDDRGLQGGEGVWLISSGLVEQQDVLPTRLTSKNNSNDLLSVDVDKPIGRLWLYKGQVYLTADKELQAEDVRALVNVEINKRRLVIEKAHALQAISDNFDRPKRREAIPQAVRLEVWQRDGGRCVECDSQAKLEFDHLIPLAMGGSNTARNLQLLCEACNRRKGASLG